VDGIETHLKACTYAGQHNTEDTTTHIEARVRFKSAMAGFNWPRSISASERATTVTSTVAFAVVIFPVDLVLAVLLCILFVWVTSIEHHLKLV
jgi:hypothetical protein